MSPLRVAALIVALAVCAVEATLLAGQAGPGVVVAPPATRVTAPAATPAPEATDAIEPSFLAHMTADDVARGVYALAAAEGPVALTTDQRARIRPLLEEGAALRARLGELRTERRRAREAWLVTGTQLADVDGASSAARAAQ